MSGKARHEQHSGIGGAMIHALFLVAILFAFPSRGVCAQRNTWDGGLVVTHEDPAGAAYAEGGGTWTTKSGGWENESWDEVGGPIRVTKAVGAWARFTPDIPKAGKYRVYYWIPNTVDGTVEIEIHFQGGVKTYTRDMTLGPCGLANLGDYDFAAGTARYVVAKNARGTVYADAVKWQPVDKLTEIKLPPYAKPDGSVPHFEKVNVGNIVVCGQPRIALTGKPYHGSGDQYWVDLCDTFLRQGMNTMTVAVDWNEFEKAKDLYDDEANDKTMVRLAAALDACKARNMFLQILWRGFSDCLGSPQAANYTRQDKATYFWITNREGKEEGQISPFCTAAAEREGLALKALLAAVAKLDPNHQVVIGVHLQNEMTGGQDYGSLAQSLSKEQVPQDLVTFLKANETPNFDPTRLGWWAFSRWADPGHGGTRRTAGNWRELFGMRGGGTSKEGDEDMHTIMGAYYTGKYLDIVAAAGKQALNIPIYCNAWMGASATDVQLFDLFHVGAPHIDGIAGDNPNWEGVQRLYKRPWNVVAAPSEFINPESHFSAIADGAFGFGQWLSPDFELNAYRPVNMMILSMEPLLVKKNLDGNGLLGFMQFPESWGFALHPKARETWEETFQNMVVTFTTSTAAGRNKTFNTTGQILNGNGLIVKMDTDDYVVTSTKIDVELRYADGRPMRVSRAERGHFEEGQWVKDGAGKIDVTPTTVKLLFPTENWKYGQIRVILSEK